MNLENVTKGWLSSVYYVLLGSNHPTHNESWRCDDKMMITLYTEHCSVWSYQFYWYYYRKYYYARMTVYALDKDWMKISTVAIEILFIYFLLILIYIIFN